MGGHHHHEPFEVPHYSAFNNTNFPHLNEYRKRLDRLGLKDPHIRNWGYRFDPKRGLDRTSLSWFWTVIRPGIKWGFPVAVTLISIEEGYSFFKHGHTSWGGGH
uniref:NADH dehydrogenase [ubiquinone] 1 beta subcomplex subunit 3 n=1 Tax=Ditylenchus dipsaci TaxID=166011 RepID=A0A915DSG2_9BILA